MSNISIQVEFLAGTEIEKAISEAKQKARMWQVAYVCFDFNGQSFSIGQNADIDQCMEEYKHGNNKYGIVSA